MHVLRSNKYYYTKGSLTKNKKESESKENNMFDPKEFDPSLEFSDIEDLEEENNDSRQNVSKKLVVTSVVPVDLPKVEPYGGNTPIRKSLRNAVKLQNKDELILLDTIDSNFSSSSSSDLTYINDKEFITPSVEEEKDDTSSSFISSSSEGLSSITEEDEEYDDEDDEDDDDGGFSEWFKTHSSNSDSSLGEVDEAKKLSIIAILRQKNPSMSEKQLLIVYEGLEGLVNGGKKLKEASESVTADGQTKKLKKWKKGLSETDAERIEKEWDTIQLSIAHKIPTIPKIINSNVSKEEKEILVKEYNKLYTLIPYTQEYYDACEAIHRKIVSSHEIQEPKAQLIKLTDKNYMSTEIVFQSVDIEEIENALLTTEEKLKARKWYEIARHYMPYSEPWFDIQQNIKNLLKTQYKTHDEMVSADEKESELKNHVFCGDISDIKRAIVQLNASVDKKAKLYEMYTSMSGKDITDASHSNMKDKLHWALKLPYNNSKKLLLPQNTRTDLEISQFCSHVYKVLSNKIYGMEYAKEIIIRYLNDRIHNPSARNIIALKGKPGVGKTKLAKTIAEAIGLPFEKINLGGSVDSTIFKGSDNVWSGATPSYLLQLLAKSGYNNPVILLDEIDKLTTNIKGLSVQHALLHVLDPLQSQSYQDAYLNEFYHDISNVWFVISMNDDKDLDPALLDRLHIIELKDYTNEEKIEILSNFTMKDALMDKGLNQGDISITKDASNYLLQKINGNIDTGMRGVEKMVYDMVSKISLWNTIFKGASTETTSFQLNYKIPKFNGYPYLISKDSIDAMKLGFVEKNNFHAMYS